MKKKFRLWLNIVTICLCMCAIMVGVYAATNAGLTVQGQIGFTAHGVEMTITGELSGFVTYDQQHTATETMTRTLKQVDLGGENPTKGTMSFADLEDTSDTPDTRVYFTDLVGATVPNIVLTLNFANSSPFPVKASINLPEIPSDYNVTVTASPANSIIMDANTGSGTLVITFALTDSDNSFESELDLSDLFTEDNTLIEFAKFLDIASMSNNHSITLANYLPDDTYTLKFENENGTLSDYAEICSLEPGEEYTGLIEQNIAPVSATEIGIYNSTGNKVGNVALASTFKKELGEKLYSFAAISDVHIGYNTSESDFATALTYFESDSSIKFIANCGDLNVGGQTSKLETYKSIITQNTTKPVYAVAGNHEASMGYLTNEVISSYTGQNLYYSYTEGNDVYIMVGMYDVHPGEQFSIEELTWLYETLEANRDKRCFVFMHLNPRDGSGDAVDLDLEGDMLSNTRGEVFYSLMSHYTNVTWFHGHTHEMFSIQEINSMNNYDNILGSHSVHIPSLAQPRAISDDGLSLVNNNDGSEGYIVDVYQNHIVLRGRDFVAGKFLPIASFCLDTELDTIEANTYYDDKQIIVNSNSNILKEADTWYSSTMAKSSITSISIVKNYTPTSYDEAWDASISGNNQVMCYRTGTELTMVGNKNGILANANSDKLFKDFSGLTEINGLENLNTSNVTSMQEGFRGCSKLTNIDISSFDLSKIVLFKGLFRDCLKLTSFRLPNKIGIQNENKSINLQKFFEGCNSLIEVDLSNLYTGEMPLSISEMFNGCSSLTKVKLGNNKISSLAVTFYNCKNIQEIDMRACDFTSLNTLAQTFNGCTNLSSLKFPANMDTSKVKEFNLTFNNCSALTLDCSSWDISSCTNYTDFNTNAPGVIAPAFN